VDYVVYVRISPGFFGDSDIGLAIDFEESDDTGLFFVVKVSRVYDKNVETAGVST